MMMQIAEAVARPIHEGGAGSRPPDARIEQILRWFSEETSTLTRKTTIGAEAMAGAGMDADTWWAKLTGLFAKLRGEIKYASDRKTELVEYRLQRLAQLIDLVNALLDDCSELLRRACYREWLLIGEDFEKLLDSRLVDELFLNYVNVFNS